MNYNLLYMLMEKVTAVTSGKGNAETVGIILWAGSQKKYSLFPSSPSVYLASQVAHYNLQRGSCYKVSLLKQ